VWYHRNEDPRPAHGVPSYYENVMRTQGLRPEDYPDPLLHRTFGAALGISAPPSAPSASASVTVEPAAAEGVEGKTPARPFLTEISLRVCSPPHETEERHGTVPGEWSAPTRPSG
jgi:hypothetical protein